MACSLSDTPLSIHSGLGLYPSLFKSRAVQVEHNGRSRRISFYEGDRSSNHGGSDRLEGRCRIESGLFNAKELHNAAAYYSQQL